MPHLPSIRRAVRCPCCCRCRIRAATMTRRCWRMRAQGRRALETLEDPLVDRLAWRAIAAGIGAVIQPVPRAVIDCNRDEEEVDPAAILGISPGAGRPSCALRARPDPVAHPSPRTALAAADRPRRTRAPDRAGPPPLPPGAGRCACIACRALTARHCCIDCHSMPPRAGGQAELVIGDRHGTSAAAMAGGAKRPGSRARRVSAWRSTIPMPAARSSRGMDGPHRGIHAIQLEI